MMVDLHLEEGDGLADFVYRKQISGYKPKIVLNHFLIMSDQFYCNKKPHVPPIDSSLEREWLIRARINYSTK